MASSQAINTADAVDREWFALHSDRFTYARAMLQHEFDGGAAGKDWLVAVRRLGDGRMVRQFFTIEGDLTEFSAGIAARVALAIDTNLQHLADSSGCALYASDTVGDTNKRKVETGENC